MPGLCRNQADSHIWLVSIYCNVTCPLTYGKLYCRLNEQMKVKMANNLNRIMNIVLTLQSKRSHRPLGIFLIWELWSEVNEKTLKCLKNRVRYDQSFILGKLLCREKMCCSRIRIESSRLVWIPKMRIRSWLGLLSYQERVLNNITYAKYLLQC